MTLNFDSRIAGLIEELPPRSRYIVHLRFAEERSFEEIGAIVGLTRERVRQVINSSLEVLRMRMDIRNIE